MTSRHGLIFKKGIFAATLNDVDGGVKFEYDTNYLTSSLPPVATTLPLTAEPRVFANGATPAFFTGLLPEGPRLIAMKNRIKTSLNNELALLLDIGSDTIGDVQILPDGASPSDEREHLPLLAKTEELDFEKLKQDFFGSRASGLPGVQDKISSKMLNARVKMADQDYILKLNPDAVPYAVENENYFLGLAKSCDINTAKFSLMTDSVGNHALSLKRFDRINRESLKLRLAAEDGCQVMNKYPSEKYDVDFVEMAKTLISLCPARGAAGFALFKQLVFNWLIGNGDAHAKNFSILESESGEWMISPAYDLLCTRFYDDREMSLAIDGQYENWSRSLLIDTAEKMWVPKKAAEKVIDRQLAALAGLPEQILESALPFARHLNIEVSGFLAKRARQIQA